MSQSAADNAEQFKQSFREEAREILVDLESALLELNENRADVELVGRVFRALHTIKGSGSMFGFEELAAFTHNLETAFDQVRNGELQIDSELIDLTLAALDQIRAMLEEGDKAVRADRRRLTADPLHDPCRHPHEGAATSRDIGEPDVWTKSQPGLQSSRQTLTTDRYSSGDCTSLQALISC